MLIDYPFKNPRLSTEIRIDDLVSRLTLTEKVAQLVHSTPAIERLGIPAYNYWNECLHGVGRSGRATVFPQAIGLAATFDPVLVERVASAVSDEARAKHHAAKKRGFHGWYAGLTFWTPNINIFRDPRWGRGQETYGECPYLTARIGVAFVRGLQGNDPKYLKVAACAKHFAVHSGPEKERHGFNAVVSQRDLRQTYLPAFKALVTEARVESVMPAYNRTLGEPCAASTLLLKDILRDEWGFQGHVVSDCGAIDDFHNDHHVTKNAAESAALAVKQGCDLNCGCTYSALTQAVEEGFISEEQIDTALKRVLSARFRLGMFDPDEKVRWSYIPPEVVGCVTHRKLALTAAEKSIVLLKNTESFLPLNSDKIKKLLLIGPAVDSVDILLGNYNGYPAVATTMLEGITAAIPVGMAMESYRHCPFNGERARDASVSADVDIVIACFGLSPRLEGEEGDADDSEACGDRINIGLPAIQEKFLLQLCELGKPIVLVLSGGSAISIPELAKHPQIKAILHVWYPGEAGGEAVSNILFGKVSPSGRMPVTVTKSVSDWPDFNDYNMAGRTYRYMNLDDKILFPFGFGLSYADFSYTNAKLKTDQLVTGETIEISATISNNSDFTADEIIQCYVHSLQTDYPAPIQQLGAFERVTVPARSSVEVTLFISPENFCLYTDIGERVYAPGKYEIYIGGSQPGCENLGAAHGLTLAFTVGKSDA